MKAAEKKNRKKPGNRLRITRIFLAAVMMIMGCIGMSAQNSMPAPGTGGSFNPAPTGGGGGGFGGPGPGFGGPGPGPGWGGPGWGWSGPSVIINTPTYVNQGTTNVVAVGYDNSGNLRTIPMRVAYYWSYGEYDATVLAAYNPYTLSWDKGLNIPAYNTSYFLNGNTYDFYVPLSTGTYYFNL